MGEMLEPKALEYGANAIDDIARPVMDDFVDVLSNAIRDTIEGLLAGRRSLDEWAHKIIDIVDETKENYENQYNLKYIGGKLNFSPSSSRHKIDIWFELYYQDTASKWVKVAAHSDVYSSNFTSDALKEIEVSECVSYSVY